MTRTTIFTLAAAALTLALAAPSTQARPQGRPPGPPPPLAHVIERHADELKLDAATLDSILALQQQEREDSRELHESLREGRGRLRALMDSDEPDETAVVAQVEKLGALETQARLARIRTDLAVRALLTSEQLETLKSLRPDRPAGGERDRQRPERSGPGGGRGDDDRPQRGGDRSQR